MRRMLILLSLLLSGAAAAQDDDLGEATGLAPTPAGEAVAPAPETGRSPVRWRAYGLVDWRGRKITGRDNYVTSGPNAEIGAAVDGSPQEGVTIFAEGRGFYDDEAERSYGVFDQGGVRLRPTESTVVALGKERNRRSPAMIVSPSDFIHTNQSVPGLREERAGVWLGRLAWQTETQSADLIALPVSLQLESGLPDDEAEYAGTAARYFHRLPGGIDLGIDVGQFDDELKGGAFLQTIAAQVWKIYAETGYDGLTESASHLVGVGYEGSSTYSVRAEWYGRDDAWAPPSPLFTDTSYAIVSVGAVELLDRFNLTDTVVRSLDTPAFFNLARAEWLVSDRMVTGLTLIHLDSEPYPPKPFRWQAIADWKVSL